MIAGLFFALLVAGLALAAAALFAAEGAKIQAALAGDSRPEPSIREVTVRWEKSQRLTQLPSPQFAAAA